jgi:Flp pilus assembly protein TadD
MRFIHLAGYAAAVLAFGLLGCASSQQQPPAPTGVTSMQEQAPLLTPQQRVNDTLVAADYQIQTLEEMRGHTNDPGTLGAIDHQVSTITLRRDALLADLSSANWRPDDPRVSADVTNLEREMQAAAATQPQAPSPPEIQRRGSASGGYGSYPPFR